MPKPLRYPNIDLAKLPLDCPGCSYHASKPEDMFTHLVRTNTINDMGMVPHSDKIVKSVPREVEVIVPVKSTTKSYSLPRIHLPIIPVSWQHIIVAAFAIVVISPTINHVLISMVDASPILSASVLVFGFMLLFKDMRRKLVPVVYLLPVALVVSRWL